MLFVGNYTMVDRPKLALSTKIGFGSGDMFGGGAMTLVGVYYLFFLTDVLRINPSLAGVVILLSKIWDAVSDPLMGAITDRTQTRWGRRRPYFLAGIPLIFLALLGLWYPVGFENEMARFFYALLTYLFFSTVYTMVLIPYYALASELTLDYTERSSLMSVRMMFSGLSAMICGAIPMAITQSAAGIRAGYSRVGLIFGLVFSLPFLAVFLTTRERAEFQPNTRRFDLRQSFIEPLRNRSFRRVLIMYLFTFVTLDIVLSVVIYFITYYLRIEGDLTFIMGALLVVQVAAIPGYFAIGKRWGKTVSYSVSAIIWMLVMLSSLLVRPGISRPMLMIFGAFVGMGTSGSVLMVWSIFADIPDIDELYSGQRREGLYSGLFTFLRKASSALGLFIVSNLLNAAGYQNPQVAPGTIEPVSQAQTDQFILVLRLIFSLLPVVFVTLALVSASNYRLSPKLHERLKSILDRRREGKPDEHPDEVTRLKSLLLGEWAVTRSRQ